MCLAPHMCSGTCGGQRRALVLKLEFQEVVSYLPWVLELELWFSVGAAHAFERRSLSPVLESPVWAGQMLFMNTGLAQSGRLHPSHSPYAQVSNCFSFLS